jgi:hypothetical protein
MANLRTESLKACGAALRAYDFSKQRGVFLQPGGDASVSGWLGLNLATRGLPEKLQVNPVVGVRHEALESALAELAGWPPPVACVSRPLGYLMPRQSFTQWDFLAGGDLTATAEELAKAVSVYGQPFIDKWSDWRTYSDDIGSSGLLLDNERPLILPLVLAINGDRAGAERLVQQELDRVGDASDVYAQSYREFARKFAGRSFDD